MTYDRWGDGYDTARAWTDGRGAPAEWNPSPTEDVEGPEEVDAEIERASDLLEAGVVASLSDGSEHASAAAAEHHDSSSDHYDPSLWQAQMMVMEAESNANMMAISGIGGLHDVNYNGYMDAGDAGCSNVYGSMGHY